MSELTVGSFAYLCMLQQIIYQYINICTSNQKHDDGRGDDEDGHESDPDVGSVRSGVEELLVQLGEVVGAVFAAVEVILEHD